VSLGYDYSLSKRTLVYAGAGYMHDKYDDFAATTVGSAYNYGVTAGLVHKF
jgi:predicted porin